jgi:hypothetical protein
MNVRPIERPLGLPRVKRSCWQPYSQSKICQRLSCEFAFAINPRTGLSREQTCLWFTGYPKRRAAIVSFGFTQAS